MRSIDTQVDVGVNKIGIKLKAFWSGADGLVKRTVGFRRCPFDILFGITAALQLIQSQILLVALSRVCRSKECAIEVLALHGQRPLLECRIHVVGEVPAVIVDDQPLSSSCSRNQ